MKLFLLLLENFFPLKDLEKDTNEILVEKMNVILQSDGLFNKGLVLEELFIEFKCNCIKKSKKMQHYMQPLTLKMVIATIEQAKIAKSENLIAQQDTVSEISTVTVSKKTINFAKAKNKLPAIILNSQLN